MLKTFSSKGSVVSTFCQWNLSREQRITDVLQEHYSFTLSCLSREPYWRVYTFSKSLTVNSIKDDGVLRD